jgi:hypothetical protein
MTVVIEVPANNLGRARLRPREGGGFRIVQVQKRQIDFIKVDVEGLKLEALRGFENPVTVNRPSYFRRITKDSAVATNAARVASFG